MIDLLIIDKKKIECTNEEEFYLNPNLSLKHVVYLNNKLSSTIYLLRSLSKRVTRRTLLTAYHGKFVSRLCYALKLVLFCTNPYTTMKMHSH